MAVLSRRIQAISPGEDDGWSVLYRARELEAAGEAVINLSVGDHDLRPPALILDAMDQSARAGNTGYTPVNGTAPLRHAIAGHYQRLSGVATNADNVIVMAGGQAALFAALTAATNPDERVGMINPYYATYPGTIRSVAAEPVSIGVSSEGGFQPRKQNFAGLPALAALLVNSPNNPTGANYDADAWHAIAACCEAHDCWLISDEVYATQVWEGERISARSLPGLKSRSLVVGSMSKSYFMTGFRLGWVIADEEVIEHLFHFATSSNYGMPGFIQDAAQRALSEGEALELSLAETYRHRREVALKALGGQNQIRIIPSQGGMYVMLDISSTGLSGQAFASRLLEERRIAVMPGESFGTASAGHLRLALTVETERLVSAIETLVDFAKSLQIRRSDA